MTKSFPLLQEMTETQDTIDLNKFDPSFEWITTLSTTTIGGLMKTVGSNGS
jgi:hypothetical protein